MKKGLIIMSILSLLLSLTGCKTVKTNYQIKRFHYVFSTSWNSGDYQFTIEKQDDNGYRLTYNPVATKYDAVTIEMNQEDVKKVEELCKKYSLASWNGFDGNNKNVYDGDSFYLSIDFEDASISAEGYMKYPKNYSEFMDDLQKILQPYFDQCLVLAKKNYAEKGFNGNIISVFVNICTNGLPKQHSYFFSTYKNEETTELYYQIEIVNKQYNDYLEVGKYYKDYTIENGDEIFSTIQSLIEKYNITVMDGVNEYDSNAEYYQLGFTYDDQQRLDVNGSFAFENYSDFRNELLEYLCSFVTE